MDQMLPQGVLVTLGEFFHALNLSQLGPRRDLLHAAKVGPESSIRTLFAYWGLTLVRMDQILPRGDSSPLG